MITFPPRIAPTATIEIIFELHMTFGRNTVVKVQLNSVPRIIDLFFALRLFSSGFATLRSSLAPTPISHGHC